MKPKNLLKVVPKLTELERAWICWVMRIDHHYNESPRNVPVVELFFLSFEEVQQELRNTRAIFLEGIADKLQALNDEN